MIIQTTIGPLHLTVNPRMLAHCRECCQPMFCIYDANLRWRCWECDAFAAAQDGPENGAEQSRKL
ncbi:MAG: hypothetical protein Q8K65_11780 [Alphaproteobacteria bacterium]|nr:hypothetical protein [Alphaproteobacteria bacterium]